MLIPCDPPDRFQTTVSADPAAHNYPTELATSARRASFAGRDTPRLGKRVFRRESFFLPARLSSHGAHGGWGDTINQSHVLGTISRSMPGPPPKSSLAPSRAFLDSGVAASSSVDAYLSTYSPACLPLGRCTVSTYSLPRARALSRNAKSTASAYDDVPLGSGAARLRTFVRIFADPFESSPARLSRCKSGRTKEDRASRSSHACRQRDLFLFYFYLKWLDAHGRLNPPEDSPAISRRPLTTSPSFV